MQKATLIATCVTALAFAGASYAQQPVQADKAKATAEATTANTATPKDATKFCYYANQAYSEGSELNGAQCRRESATTVFDRASLPLSWVRAPEIRSVHPKPSDEN